MWDTEWSGDSGAGEDMMVQEKKMQIVGERFFWGLHALCVKVTRPLSSPLSSMTYNCPGCRKVFPTSKAVANHRRSCQEYKDAPTTILKKRRQDFDQYTEVQRRRKEAQHLVPVQEASFMPLLEDHVTIPMLFQLYFM